MPDAQNRQQQGQEAAPRRSRDQKCAAHAWQFLAKPPNGMEADKIGTAAKKTCTRIMTSGLGPSIAFCLTKHDAKGDDKQQFLVAGTLAIFLGHQQGAKAFLDHIVNKASADELRRATEDALRYLTWLARLADGDVVRNRP